jgi:preprotein translocase subunit SecA
MVIESACNQVDNKDSSILAEFLSEGFAEQTFVDVINARFNLSIKAEELKDRDPQDIKDQIVSLIGEKYDAKEIEYPIDFALGMVFTPQGVNAYGFETLCKWAKMRYGLSLNTEELQQMQPADIREKLLAAARETHDNFQQQIRDKASGGAEPFAGWMQERYHIKFAPELLEDMDKVVENSVELVRSMLRSELARLEKYVLLQIYDSAWKDHLYAMDRLKESIFLRSFAEKDPKVEYKREGYKMFQEMLSSVRQRVTDTIFKVRLAANENSRNVYSGQNESHDAAKQFAQNETQRAAAMAPQRSAPAAPIVNEQPKVGRNDPCPCGSGKKYKKCCGANA